MISPMSGYDIGIESLISYIETRIRLLSSQIFIKN